MSGYAADASAWMRNAIHLDAEKKFIEAEECYTRALYIFRSALADPTMSDIDRRSLMNYMSDVAKRIQRLRAVNQNTAAADPLAVALPPLTSHRESSTASPVRHDAGRAGRNSGPAVTPTSVSNMPDKDVSDWSFLADMKVSKAALTSHTGSNAASLSNTQRSSSDASLNGGRNGAPVPPSAALDQGAMPSPKGSDQGDGKPMKPVATFGSSAPPPSLGVAAHFAPRTSDMVMKAIDIATQLNRQGEIKRAVDVLQHAYSIGSRERHNPANFKDIAETLNLMRRRYYQLFPPRFLQDNPVLPQEMELLRRSGTTSTILLPIWDDVTEGYGAENVFMPGEKLWEDAFTPKLAPSQKKAGAQLVHVSDFAARDQEYTIVRDADPLHIRQSVVGDCSLVCSLMICASYQKRFPKAKIISNAIFPQDRDGNPILNPKGKYCVKMLINGMTRLVTVDDRLPVNPRSKKLLCTASTDPSELWVSIMEKAFIKVCGGSYDFPGSSSYSDLYKLSGWLPDSFFFSNQSFDAEYQWRRLFPNFVSGSVLLTVSTGSPLGADAKRLGLADGHAFAVLDMREVGGERVMMLRNPWGKQEWKGKYGSHDTSESSLMAREAFGLTHEMEALGVFCIAYDDVVAYYEQCSLSWNPYLLYRGQEGMSRRPVRLACHGTFSYTLSVAQMPQLHIGVVGAPHRSRMHLVLSRHVTDVSEFGLQFDSDNETIPFLALKVYDVTDYPSVAQHLGGKCTLEMCYCRRLASSSDFDARLKPLNDVVYRNAAARTFSFDCPAGNTNLVVVVSRTSSACKTPFNFTVTLHTELEQLRLPRSTPIATSDSKKRGEDGSDDLNGGSLLASTNANAGNPSAGVFMHFIPTAALKHVTALKGAWVKGKTCGGRSNAATYVFNPQYRLYLEQPSHISLRLAVPECNTACNIQLLRLRRCETDAGGSASARLGQVSFHGRVGNPYHDGELMLESHMYTFGGAVVDSSLPVCIGFDMYRALGNRPPKATKKVIIKMKWNGCKAVAGVPEVMTVYDLEDGDSVTELLLYAVKKGILASPRQSTLSVNGQPIALDATIQSIFNIAASSFGADSDTGISSSKLQRSATVELTLDATTAAISGTTGSAAENLKRDLQGIVMDVLDCSSQLSSYIPRLTYVARQATTRLVSPEHAELKSYLIEISAFIGDYLKRCSEATRVASATSECLPPLPAGTYTVIPSLWEKGTPGAYELTVESTSRHQLVELPEEGSGFSEKRISGELSAQGSRISAGLLKPGLILRKEDAFFKNTKISFSFQSRGTFTCRIFFLEDAADAEARGQSTAAPSANLSLFQVNDAQSMALVQASGDYSSSGVAIPLTVLEAKVTYLIVVSATDASSRAKFLLRIYSSTSCSAQLTV